MSRLEDVTFFMPGGFESAAGAGDLADVVGVASVVGAPGVLEDGRKSVTFRHGLRSGTGFPSLAAPYKKDKSIQLQLETRSREISTFFAGMSFSPLRISS